MVRIWLRFRSFLVDLSTSTERSKGSGAALAKFGPFIELWFAPFPAASKFYSILFVSSSDRSHKSRHESWWGSIGRRESFTGSKLWLEEVVRPTYIVSEDFELLFKTTYA